MTQKCESYLLVPYKLQLHFQNLYQLSSSFHHPSSSIESVASAHANSNKIRAEYVIISSGCFEELQVFVPAPVTLINPGIHTILEIALVSI